MPSFIQNLNSTRQTEATVLGICCISPGCREGGKDSVTKRLPTRHSGENTAQLRDDPPSSAASLKYGRVQGARPSSSLPPGAQKGSNWEPGPAAVIRPSRHWLRKQKQVSEKVFCSRESLLSSGSCGRGRGSFGFDQNTSPLGGQAQLCFAAARLVTVQEQD